MMDTRLMTFLTKRWMSLCLFRRCQSRCPSAVNHLALQTPLNLFMIIQRNGPSEKSPIWFDLLYQSLTYLQDLPSLSKALPQLLILWQNGSP